MTRRITPSQTETPRDPRRKGTTPEFPFTPGPCLDVGRTSELTGVRRHLRGVHDRAPSTSPCPQTLSTYQHQRSQPDTAHSATRQLRRLPLYTLGSAATPPRRSLSYSKHRNAQQTCPSGAALRPVLLGRSTALRHAADVCSRTRGRATGPAPLRRHHGSSSALAPHSLHVTDREQG